MTDTVLLREIVKPRNRQATDAELRLFAAICERTGLDPLARQIYATFRRDRNGVEQMSVQATIDGFRVVAERSGDYLGGDSPEWCASDGQWVDVWLNDSPPQAARVTVHKAVSGQRASTTVVAHWREYAPDTSQPAGRMWKQMPALMLAKVAEALALRRAFPMVLSGLYTAEEMAQAERGAHSEDGDVVVRQIRDERVGSFAPVTPLDELLSAAKGMTLAAVQACYQTVGLEAPRRKADCFQHLTTEQASWLLAALRDRNSKVKGPDASRTDVPVGPAEMETPEAEPADDLPWAPDPSATLSPSADGKDEKDAAAA